MNFNSTVIYSIVFICSYIIEPNIYEEQATVEIMFWI